MGGEAQEPIPSKIKGMLIITHTQKKKYGGEKNKETKKKVGYGLGSIF